MYSTGESQLKCIEELVLDFLIFRKNKQCLKNNSCVTNYTENMDLPLYSNCLDYSFHDYDAQNFMYEETDEKVMDPETNMDFMYQLYSEINKRLHDYIVQVLNENEYEGSPLYDEKISKEFLAQLVDQVLQKAANSINEIEDISLETDTPYWGRSNLLRSATESSLLHELYGNRKYRYKNFNK